MRITWATVALLSWFGVMLVAFISAVVACLRRRVRGLAHGGVMLFGGLLTFGFVSGIIGVYKTTGYAQTIPFWVSITAGLAGLALLLFGIKRVWIDLL